MREPINPSRIYPAQTDTQSLGGLKLNISAASNNRPIEGATIDISYTGEPDTTLEELKTDAAGVAGTIDLPAPPQELSLEPSAIQPYSEYTFRITAPGYEPVVITGAEILAGVTAIQNASLDPVTEVANSAEAYVIGPHTLFGDYPPKIIEDEIKPMDESGEIVLSRVVIPEYVVVHDGPPRDASAKNYYVRYRDYIKNVASSEIYATWPESTILANVLAIQSFTLNRVYTEWYRGRGYNFTITSSTAYDHKWIPERNVFDTINSAVDSVFNNFLSRPNVRQPILTQYCDGNRVQCPGLMTQWGSKDLGDQGYTPIEILHNFYGDSLYINSTDEISGVPSSWPGYDLTIGASGDKVRQLQEQLDAIADVYYPIPNVSADGIYGQQTADAVRAFQEYFDLPATGVVNFATWYKISAIYVAISRIAEYE